MPDTDHEHDHSESAVWIRIDPTHDGASFALIMETGPDETVSLNYDSATKHAHAVLGAVAHAEYDAAVLRQLTRKLSLDTTTAMQMIVDMRKDRPPLDWSASGALSLAPGVNSKFKPFLTVLLAGQPTGQWEVEDARQHARHIIESLTVADLDTVYLRTLKGLVGIEDGTARRVIEELADFR